VVEADLAIELRLDLGGEDQVALFHWAVNFGVEQLCVWKQPLDVVWPRHAESKRYDLPTAWLGWPHGQLRR
jgi:hypothetical protein